MMENCPFVDPSGDLWVSRDWVRELAPSLRPGEFMYLVWKKSGLPVTRLGMSKSSRLRARKALLERGLL